MSRKNKHNFDVMSDKVCIVNNCNNKIKLNVIERANNVKECYSCWKKEQTSKGHRIRTGNRG